MYALPWKGVLEVLVDLQSRIQWLHGLMSGSVVFLGTKPKCAEVQWFVDSKRVAFGELGDGFC
jgi:hypothetical protein